MADSLFSVADKVTLVSGGSRGIGRALAQGFVERRAKWPTIQPQLSSMCPRCGR